MKEPLAVPPSPLTSPAFDAPVVTTSAPRTASRRVSRTWFVLAALFLAALVVVAGGALGAYASWSKSSRIAPSVAIADVPVGGLSRDEAIERVQAQFRDSAVVLKADDQSFSFELSDLGATVLAEEAVEKASTVGREGWLGSKLLRLYAPGANRQQIELPISWDRSQLESKLEETNRSFARPARDARLILSPLGSSVQSEQSGRSLDVMATAHHIETTFRPGGKEVTAVVREEKPEILASQLEGQDVKIGEYRTRFNPGLRGRTTNIRVACAAIEGTVLMPGDSFSFNKATGKRTWEKGYRMAHIFERKPGETESQVVDGLAGGVCQVSSTLYNAVRKSNNALETGRIAIVERNSHSLPVTYVPRGLDATVAWPSLDFRFRNTLSHPIYLRTHVRGSRLTIEVWGRVQT